jgi:hypothetical protein
MTVEEIGLNTGMLNEDVITALKSMGLFEPQATPKKRKSNRTSTGEDPPPGQMVTISKSDVWEWAQSHHLALDDPVCEKGFEGLWPPVIISAESDESILSEED